MNLKFLRSCLIVSFIWVCLLQFACTAPEPPPTEVDYQPLRLFSSDSLYKSDEAPKCKFLLDSYCNILYSPDSLGNLEIRRAQTSSKVLQGETTNGFSQVYFRYSEAKIKNQKYLPKDFYAVLVQNNYFTKLQEFLARQARKKMTVSQRLLAESRDYELGSIWSASLNETVLKRMIKKYPGYHQIPDKMIPIELSLENRRARRLLISEVSSAIWKGDKNWKKVEDGFRRLQASYLKMISRLDIPAEIAQDWSNRIREVKLVLPGSFPAISNDECSTMTINAYYYTYLNVLTICAGDFNSEDIIQTLAHEMGHSLGIDRSQYLFEVNSEFGQGLAKFRTQVCAHKTFSCDDWTEYKNNFEDQLDSLDGYHAQLPVFQSCLKRRQTSKKLKAADIRRFTRTIVGDRISNLASSDRFLRITKERTPNRLGQNQKNPNYLNPCSYYMWTQKEEPIDDELTTMMYFTAEYRCSQKPPIEKMKGAIELAKRMSTQLIEKTLRIEGEFSARNNLESEGFASPPYERFADVIGSYAMAEFLKELPDKRDRQNVFLASSSWQCLEPSLASHFPEESAIEKEYSFDTHTEGDQRRKELFSEPIREAISCEKDFEFKECSLDFKD